MNYTAATTIIMQEERLLMGVDGGNFALYNFTFLIVRQFHILDLVFVIDFYRYLLKMILLPFCSKQNNLTSKDTV